VIRQITLHPNQVIAGTRYRSDNELDEDFLESIKSKGILQPITISQNFELVAGGSRLGAARVLGLEEIPCLVREMDGELDLRECELIENTFRKDLNWQNKNSLVVRINELMSEKHGSRGSQARTAEILNKSVGGVSRHIQLAKAIKLFPKLAECATEDDAVKTFRKLSEKVLVKELIKQQTEKLNELKKDASIIEDKPLGVRLAAYASDHYRVGDAFMGMQELVDEKLVPPFALVEVDPPYGIDLAEKKKGDTNVGIGEYNEIDADDYAEFLYNTCDYIYAVTPKTTRVIFWFAVEWYELVRTSLERSGFTVDPIPGIWAKPAGQTASPDRYLARCYETFFIAWKEKVPPIPKRGRSNIFSFASEPPSTKFHPTQRPLALMQELLRTFAWPGSVILVPFLGGGSTLRAAYSLGISGFGWDLSEVYKEGFLGAVQRDIEEGVYNDVEAEQND